MRAMLPTQRCARVEDPSLKRRWACSMPMAVSGPLGVPPARCTSRPGSGPRASRRGQAATPRPCKAATVTAPPRSSQAGAGADEGRHIASEDAAHNTEPPAAATLTRAVVVGGSAAGMFAAAAAAPHFDEVIILERDEQLPERAAHEAYTDGSEYAKDGRARRGVPQYVQVHAITAKGWEVAERYMPGVKAAMEAAGAQRCNVLTECKEIVSGIEAYTPGAKGQLMNLFASRALVERVIREKLLETHANVAFRWASPAAGFQHGSGADEGCITGVSLQDGMVLRSDLVVDASGPRGMTKTWLADGGYPVQDIRTVEVDPHVGYTMEVLDVPDEVANQIKWKFSYVRPVAPETKGYLAMQVERGRFQVCTIGYGKDNHPPMDHDGFVAFVDSLHQQEASKIVHSGTSVLRRSYRATKDVRHYYEDIQLPGNFAVVGDAVAKFNPAYGQGITVAAVQVEALEAVLKERQIAVTERLAYAQLRDLSSDLQKRISAKVDFAWTVACSEDLKHPTTDGERTNSWVADAFAAYFQQVWFAATVDEHVRMAFMRVGNMMDEAPALLTPNIILRVALYRLSRLLSVIKPPAVGSSAAAPLL